MNTIIEPKVVEEKVNKSNVVRSILRDIGALEYNPPKKWRETVEKTLAERNLKINKVSIYQIRRNEIEKLHPVTPIAPIARSKPESNKSPKISSDLTFKELRAVQEFSKNFGGLDGLNDAITALKSLIVD